MNRGRVYTPLGFIACAVDAVQANAMNPGRVYTPQGFIAFPLHLLQRKPIKATVNRDLPTIRFLKLRLSPN